MLPTTNKATRKTSSVLTVSKQRLNLWSRLLKKMSSVRLSQRQNKLGILRQKRRIQKTKSRVRKTGIKNLRVTRS